MPAPDQHSLTKKLFFMKHSFIALSIFAATLTATLVACSKKDWLPTDETSARQYTPYGKNNNSIHLPVIEKPRIKIIPAAKMDTPYGKINTSVHFPLTEEPGIRMIPAAKMDTPYGKVSTTVIKPLE
jgi:hypothetical protein